jgi:hypothetical protein
MKTYCFPLGVPLEAHACYDAREALKKGELSQEDFDQRELLIEVLKQQE